jgi:hypothetical protein
MWVLPETYLLLFFSGTAYILVDIGIGVANDISSKLRETRLE